MEDNVGQSQRTDITLVNHNNSLGPPLPIPLHTKPVLTTVCALCAPCYDCEQVETAWMQALANEEDRASSDDEYFSADEEPEQQVTDDIQPPYTQVPRTPSPTNVSDFATDSESEYWSNVNDFDYEDDNFSSTFTRGCNGERGIGSSANSGPSLPGPSTLVHANTSNSVAAHPLSMSPSPSKRKKKNYYTVTRGRQLGVFNSWHLAKASITGVDGLAVGYDTLQEAWQAFDEARELRALVLFE